MLAVCLCACGTTATGPENIASPTRRLTQAQYRHVVADIFGPAIQVVGRMDPDVRRDGLLQIGAAEATFTPGNLEQYDGLARAISADVLSERNRRAFMPCAPRSPVTRDDVCARQFISQTGRLLFRRKLTAKEADAYTALAGGAAEQLESFYQGLASGLAGLLAAPPFLFRKETLEADRQHPSSLRLDAYSTASRLSFFLWDSAPDDALLKAAETGELGTQRGLAVQVDRMLASPRLKEGMRGFFSDFLQYASFDSLAKDSVIYPKFSQTVAADAREQTLRTIENLLVDEDGDYRDLFTTRKTFMSRALGVVYRVPVPASGPWMKYEFPGSDPRAGLLTQLSFTMLYAHPGRSSATLRGKAVREILLCQTVPTPPNNVNFVLLEDTKNPDYKTARDRLTAHRSEAMCAGCHKITDPIGLGLESFDGAGQFRAAENGSPIDAAGEFDGFQFHDAESLGQALHDNPRTSACLVDKLIAYGLGRSATKDAEPWIGSLQNAFAQDGYRLPRLMRRIATDDAFYRPRIQPRDSSSPTLGLNREPKGNPP